MPEPKLPVYTSPRPWNDIRPHTLVVCCSDGRYRPHLEEFVNSLVCERPDVIALPGGPANADGWSSSFDHARVFDESLGLLLASHDLQEVWLVAHEGCSYYRHKHPSLDPAQLMQRKIDDLRRAREHVLERRPSLVVHRIHLRVEEGRVLFDSHDTP
jgi:hypothetical protein